MGRAPCCDKANVKKGPWSPEEDARLKAYIEKFGTGGNWIALPQKIGLKRCGKSCRLRWLNYLRPNIKHGGFTEEEDNIICSLYISIGSRWSIIAAQLPGRTDNDIKNYWNTRLKKKLLGRRKQSSSGGFSNINNLRNGLGNELDNESSSSNALSNSALERLQLHMQLLHQQQGLQNQNPNAYPNFYSWPTITKLHHPQIIKNPNNNDHDHQSQQKDHHRGQLFYKPTLSSSSSVPFVAAAAAGDNDHQQVSDALQAELDEILRNNNRSMMMSYNNNNNHQDDDQIQIADFDNSFAEMNSNNNYMWWSNNININNDLMVKSSAASSSSTAPVLQQPEGMFQDDYELPVPGYTL